VPGGTPGESEHVRSEIPEVVAVSARSLFAAVSAAAVLLVPAAADAKTAPKVAASQECANANLMPAADNLDLIRAAVLCLHNQIRAAKGLPALKDNAKLRTAAAGHSADMVGEGFFDHTDPDGDTFVDRILGARYAKQSDGWTLGENLAWGTGDLSTPAGVMNAWMNSAGHKANILKRSYKEVGIGIRLGVPTDAGVGATFTADFGAKS
jgi:uncharacterized protein YkwD